MIATCTHLESREAIQQLVGRDASVETDLVRRMGRDRWGMRIDSVLAGSDSRRILEEIERVRAFVCPYSLDSSPVACRGDRCTVREEEQSMGACTSDSGGVVFRSMADLKRHVRSKHNMMYWCVDELSMICLYILSFSFLVLCYGFINLSICCNRAHRVEGKKEEEEEEMFLRMSEHWKITGMERGPIETRMRRFLSFVNCTVLFLP